MGGRSWELLSKPRLRFARARLRPPAQADLRTSYGRKVGTARTIRTWLLALALGAAAAVAASAADTAARKSNPAGRLDQSSPAACRLKTPSPCQSLRRSETVRLSEARAIVQAAFSCRTLLAL